MPSTGMHFSEITLIVHFQLYLLALPPLVLMLATKAPIYEFAVVITLLLIGFQIP